MPRKQIAQGVAPWFRLGNTDPDGIRGGATELQVRECPESPFKMVDLTIEDVVHRSTKRVQSIRLSPQQARQLADELINYLDDE